MNIHHHIQRQRPYPQKLSIKAEIIFSVLIVLLGLVLGFVAKMTDSISIIGHIGTEKGVWVFAATMIAAFSRYPFSAAINVFLFFISMLFAYYMYGNFVLGFFPKSYFWGWLVVALLSPFAGFVIWFSKADTIVGTVIASLPAGFLFAHGYPAIVSLSDSFLFARGYPALYTHGLAQVVSLPMGLVCCLVLPRTVKQKGIAFAIAIPIAFIFTKLDIIRLLPF